ncbi:class I SAM-dependent methyltransferase [Inquilinus limosus]|uniref:class I SAM-dependent methyltransferase n=1 Tax=Inquilinus limosus TaxID=171674 RepID=UPI003F17C98D
MAAGSDAWRAGQSYEQYMGRWSRRIAARFIAWLAPPRDADWLEIGCGTGALTATILADAAPRSVLAIDPSADFVAHARSTIDDTRVRFEVADARSLPAAEASVDVVASALVLNFIPDRPAALAEMRRVLRPDGLLAFYVWDYPGGGMGFIDAFWKAVAELGLQSGAPDEGQRFPFCTRDGLTALCREAGFRSVAVEPIEIETVFPDFEAFWQPFTLGAGPAPSYCVGLPEERRAALKAQLAGMLGTGSPIRLGARAWAVTARSARSA